jgi:hypothetical protein
LKLYIIFLINDKYNDNDSNNSNSDDNDDDDDDDDMCEKSYKEIIKLKGI